MSGLKVRQHFNELYISTLAVIVVRLDTKPWKIAISLIDIAAI
jgi:hypothetical protein